MNGWDEGTHNTVVRRRRSRKSQDESSYVTTNVRASVFIVSSFF